MIKMNSFLKNNILKIIITLLLISPFLDLITSLSINVLKINFNFITVIKLIIMFIMVYYVMFLSRSKYKKISIYYYLLIFLYFIMYEVSIFIYKDFSVLMYENQNLLRTFYFPIMLVSLININEDKKIILNNKNIFIILFIYILLMFVPTITKTSFNSYAYSKTGSIGWFNSANEIGGILSILLPLSLIYLSKIKSIFLKIITFGIIVFTYFGMGSKVPILSFGIILLLLLIRYIIKIIKNRESNKIIISVVLIFITLITSFIMIPKTSFYKNIVIHLEFLKIESINDLLDIETIDHFVFSERIKFLGLTKDNYINSSLYEKMFGIGYIENYSSDQVRVKMIEMDYYDVYFRHGLVGFIIYFIPIIYILNKIFRRLKNYNKLDIDQYMLIISVILIFVLSLFSGHIMTAPSVSLFVAILIILLYNRFEVIYENRILNSKL